MKITSVKPLPDYRLELAFDDGMNGIVDVSAIAGRGVFSAWTEPGVFERVSINADGALEWPGELDLCPDSLYLQMTGRTADDVFPALKNRLSHA